MTGSALALALILLTGQRRRFLLAWASLVVVLYLNPVVAPLWMAKLTGSSVYWRLFHLFPLHASLASASAGVLERLRVTRWAPGLAFSAIVCALAVVLSMVPGSSSVFRRGGRLGWPSYKVNDDSLQVARYVVQTAPPGVMLAPAGISGVTVMISGQYPQVRIREEPLRQWLIPLQRADEAEMRIRASDFAGGADRYLDDFRNLVTADPSIRIIVLRKELYRGVRSLLRSRDYLNEGEVDGYVVLWK